MDIFGSLPAILVLVLVYGGFIALGLWLGYLVIKMAVRNGMKEHTRWLETRGIAQ